MYVYSFIHTTYSWCDNDYAIDTHEIFETYEDALIYFEAKMESKIREYLSEANVQTLEEFEDEFCYVSMPNFKDRTEPKDNSDYSWPNFYISLDEYGSETMQLIKRRVMKFN